MDLLERKSRKDFAGLAGDVTAHTRAVMENRKEIGEFLEKKAEEMRQLCHEDLAKIRQMLEETKERLYVMASFDILETFRKELETLVQNGKKVVLISDDFEIPKAIYHKTQTEKNQIRLIVDSSFVLTGEISGSEHDTCLYSGQQNLVDVMKEALKNKIELLGR